MSDMFLAPSLTKDPAFSQLATALGITAPHAVGLVVGVLGEVTMHIARGNLANVSDAQLESWVDWTGTPGDFATHFRRLFCGTDGVLLGWNPTERQYVGPNFRGE